MELVSEETLPQAKATGRRKHDPLKEGKESQEGKGQNSKDNTTGYISSIYSTSSSSSFLTDSHFLQAATLLHTVTCFRGR